MYNCILHATDLSSNHYPICKQAVQLAKKLDAELHFLHVIEPPTSLQIAQNLGFAEYVNPSVKDVKAIMAVLGEDLGIPPSQQHVEVGSTHQYILDYVKRLSCNLIILGSHVASGLPVFLGSTAHAIMHHAPCDILTIRS